MNSKARRVRKAHLNSYKRICSKMNAKNGFYKKGEWKSLERKRIYHSQVVDKMDSVKRKLSKDEKRKIFNSIHVREY